jgi:hypothetical protein
MLSSGGRAFSARGSRRGQSLLLTWLQSDCLQLSPSGTQAAALRADLHVSTPAASFSTGEIANLVASGDAQRDIIAASDLCTHTCGIALIPYTQPQLQ